MKDVNVLKEFRKDAGDSKTESVKELIETGSTYWYRGCAIDAPDRVIALRLETGITIQFNEEDVLDIQKEDGQYHVQVKEGANLLASYQMTAKVKGNTDSCGCDEDSKAEEANQSGVTTRSIINSSPSGDLGMDDIFRPPGLGFYFCFFKSYLTER